MLLNCGVEKTLESPLDFKEIQPVHSEGDQSWVFIGGTDTKAETPILWPPHAKSGKEFSSFFKNTCNYHMEGMMLKLKLQYFGHLMRRVDSLEKNSDAGRDWGQEEKGTTEDEMAGWHH